MSSTDPDPPSTPSDAATAGKDNAAVVSAPSSEESRKKRQAEEEDAAAAADGGPPPTKKVQTGDVDPAQGRQDPAAAAASGGSPAAAAAKVAAVVDICESLGLKPGDRVEVTWDVHLPVVAEGVEAGTPFSSATANAAAAAAVDADAHNETRTVRRWWPATLLSADGRTHTLTDEEGGEGGEVVLVRMLDYDPFPEMGFPDRSVEDICFLSDVDVYNISTEGQAHWRREGSSWEPEEEWFVFTEDEAASLSEDQKMKAHAIITEAKASLARKLNSEGRTSATEDDIAKLRNEVLAKIMAPQKPRIEANGDYTFRAANDDQKREHLRTLLDGVLGSVLAKMTDQMRTLPAAQQAAVADKIVNAKEKILEKLVQQEHATLNGDHIKALMAEVGNEL